MMSGDTIKFFQSFIAQMVEIGGINLPRSIATTLGRYLGNIYKDRGVKDMKDAIQAMFRGMGGETKSFRERDGGFQLLVEYPAPFCPIGGNHKPQRFNIFNESICRPYAVGFLSAFTDKKKIKITFPNCVLKQGDCKCGVEVQVA